MGQVLNDGAPVEDRATHGVQSTHPVTAGKRVGYLLAIAVNALMAFVANNILAWDIASFLTDDFERVLPAINLMIAVTIAINFALLFYAPRWFVAATDVLSTGFGLAATVRMYRVFPFDFDAFEFDWGLVVKLLLIVAIIGSVAGIAIGLFKTVTGLLSAS